MVVCVLASASLRTERSVLLTVSSSWWDAVSVLVVVSISSVPLSMEDEVIDDILSEIQGLNKFFDDPRKYTAEMRRALLNNLSTLNSVFSGSRYSGFAEKIEERIKARLYAEFPNLKSRRNDIVLSFIIQGTFHTIATSAGKEVPDSEDLETIARLT